MDSALFRRVERELYSYSFNRAYLATLIDRQKCLATLRSPSDFSSERVQGGGDDPLWWYLEQAEFYDEEILRYRLRVFPIERMLEFLQESAPDEFAMFGFRYRQKLSWSEVESEMAISERSRYRIRRSLVCYGAKFLGLVNQNC